MASISIIGRSRHASLNNPRGNTLSHRLLRVINGPPLHFSSLKLNPLPLQLPLIRPSPFTYLAHYHSSPRCAIKSVSACGSWETWEARDLSELPDSVAGYRNDELRFISLGMIRTGYHRWGFVVYRCTYDDQDLWDRYLSQLKENSYNQLVDGRRAELLEQYLDWVVIEDRDTLNNASKADVRKHFNQWVSEHAAETSAHPDIIDLPRFRYCLYVDQKCLNTLEPFQKSELPPISKKRKTKDTEKPMVVAFIDRLWTPNQEYEQKVGFRDEVEDDENDIESEEDEENDYIYDPMAEGGYPPVEGCDKKYVGWEYRSAVYITSAYNELYGFRLDDVLDYVRPPAIYPLGMEVMPE
ncbi:uncharacterized protein CTRU02_205755 [Colletotrichum truncatum]|uniref:Uncharacterized protein n=1 Tax=Colletotrichum truncatum TaxID=5467 RepID=A0ACC3Z4Z7_COLTU|nr:uncharacterized protein CTRU02_09505 [Colletotrichum truncatum]KAF6788697.1 hypothetical protein CTRU02_09505 [Colletotrichum truncatum]